MRHQHNRQVQREQCGRLHVMNLIKVYSSSKKEQIVIAFDRSVPSQLILKYTYMLDVLIHHIVHLTYFDYTLPVLQNFEKTM